MSSLTEEAVGLLNSDKDLSEFGVLLNESWQVKRSLGALVSNPSVDSIYDRALRSGASGGKLLGAGGGGFMVLFAPPEVQPRVRAELSEFIHVPFRFEFGGSQVIFMDRQEDYLSEDISRPDVRFRELDTDLKG
jgi:D-glycero-alpha-D-manno-heptose-7-phosphate kinase